MCGICGVASIGPRAVVEPDDILRMITPLTHRGPDSSGYYHDRHAALGQTRLSIIDLATGDQPLSNEDGSIWIVFNGEIFNYLELAGELTAHGHRFATKSDTEVIVHAFEQWGTGCFSRFNGQWAVALWEPRRGRLTLSRDRLGLKPLYHTVHDGKLLFASEIKSIFGVPGVRRELDPDGLAETFTYWGPPAPRTAFLGIESLEPGCTAVLENGRLTVTRYWETPFPAAGEELSVSFDEAAEELRNRLTDAARLRFSRSDVPVAAYLSGGIDSAVVSSLIANVTPAPLRTFSVRFADDEFDESRYQDEMSRALGTRHDSITVTYRDIGAVFPEVIRHTEQPLLRTAAAPLYLLSKLVHDAGFKVVVTGEGSDEVLAGYDIFKEAAARRFLAADPSSGKRREIFYRLYPWMKHSPNRVPAFAGMFFGRTGEPDAPEFSHRLRWDVSSSLLGLLHPVLRGRLSDQSPEHRLRTALPESFPYWSPLARAQWLETKTLLEPYILSAQGDRVLMANAVEGRFPFLDVRVVEFAAKLPPAFKLFGMEEKYLLKRAFRDLVPRSILTRPKQPYRAPDAPSFFSDGRPPEWAEELLSPGNLEKTGIFDPALTTALVEKCSRLHGRRMSNTDNMRIVAVLSTLLLHDAFVAHPPEPVRLANRPERVIHAETPQRPGGPEERRERAQRTVGPPV